MKKLDINTFSKVPGVSTPDRQVDTSALKNPAVSAVPNGSSKFIVSKEEVKANITTKRQSKFLGTYPLIFTSEDSQFPVACDASGAYAVYEDHVVVTFSNMKFTHLSQERFPSPFKEDRNIEALSMFIIKRSSSSWEKTEESNIIQYKITLQPDKEVLGGSKTFKIPVTNVESLNGFEFNIRIFSELAKGSHYNAFSKKLFSSPQNN